MYDNPDNGWTSVILYNVSGPRITEYGVYTMPDTSDTPFHRLDLVMAKTFTNQLKVGLKVKNILGSSLTGFRRVVQSVSG